MLIHRCCPNSRGAARLVSRLDRWLFSLWPRSGGSEVNGQGPGWQRVGISAPDSRHRSEKT
eukprot:10572790-Alexandrium_andersonii.AAC.1